MSNAVPLADFLRAAGVRFVLHQHRAVRTAEDIRSGTDFPVASSVKVMAFGVGADRLALAAFPGTHRLKYGRLAAALEVSRSVLRPAEPARLAALGMEPGGVSPFCTQPGVTLVVDSAVPGLGRVFCGSGRADHTLEVDAADILRLAHDPTVHDIAACPA